ncbi:hypothetical protein [Sandarakinorhabdus rubra]|uniref:hypothetical protein n=1 Tax=Sandarakinorhabdus rubra TaxID=2672568 RepID=UPI0013DC76EB|nr:hypothetical protein [Sandarakinorhabdus rubra]
MTSVSNEPRSPLDAPRHSPDTEPPFHVELTPVSVDARPFHALHGGPGGLPAAMPPPHLDAGALHHPPAKPKTES